MDTTRTCEYQVGQSPRTAAGAPAGPAGPGGPRTRASAPHGPIERMCGTLRLAGIGLLLLSGAWAQPPRPAAAALPEAPDAQRTQDELRQLLDHYPPTLRTVLAADPTLLSNQTYLTPYPALASFLAAHPDVMHNPRFFVGETHVQDANDRIAEFYRDTFGHILALTAFGMALGLLTWLIRTMIDYRRWSRLTRVQTDVHAKLLDRFSNNEDLLAYVQSPAGRHFLESTPIALDSAPRRVAAPMARILWSVQGGIVMAAAGIGLQITSRLFSDVAARPVQGLGVLAIALGAGFIIAALISYFLSKRLGLFELPVTAPRIPQA
jgi:hypothetical protein